MSDVSPNFGLNAGFAAELYERYQQDPSSVDPATRALFDAGLRPDIDKVSAPSVPSAAPITLPPTDTAPVYDVDLVVRAARLGRLVREIGHMDAHLDPLGSAPPGDPELTLDYHRLTEDNLAALPASVVIGGPLAESSGNALDALQKLRAAYCGSIGYEDDHIQLLSERKWLRDAVETGRFFATITDDDRRQLLERLTEVDGFEQFLEKVQPYQGQKRFSIEGLDIMVPVLDALIRGAAEGGCRDVAIGMAHRGRLNVLTHVLGKPYEAILSEFPTNPRAAEALPSSGGGTHGYTGDVKYHKGYRRQFATPDGAGMPITLAPNPSHLEFVNPVVVGRSRAALETRDAGGPPKLALERSLPILIHGDAAFPGQGVVAETLNLSNLDGYKVGGAIHIIANNQIGFTTDPGDGRSTLYASDLAKGFEIPIVHVNGDDPEACLAVARMAVAYRHEFGKDFLIDLIGYRRLGHNEADEPAFTQPLMYDAIRSHPRLREKWAAELVKRGLIKIEDADALMRKVRERLQEAKAVALSSKKPYAPPVVSSSGEAAPPATAVPQERLRAINAYLNTAPAGFSVDPKLEKGFLLVRAGALDAANPQINWAHAEALALGSILEDGVPIRLTGQDTQRGTFTQRQLVLHDIKTGATFSPLLSLPTARASMSLINSPLSETAALGFEYGYSVQAEGTMVLWEAQFGDFANGGQVIIDQFLVSGKVKWGQTPSLVLLLPHGYEGAGPEHSSARLERFLQLCAADNLRVANCSTSGQYFHLLRLHAANLATDPRPLVLMTPKSLLRHPRASVTLADLTDQTFRSVLDDPRDASRKANVTRLILCSGKVYVDLVYGGAPEYAERPEYISTGGVAIARVEELYPFPERALTELIASYPALREIVWLQEEPHNMGAWSFIAPRLRPLVPGSAKMAYIGRPDEASPAEGSQTAHNAEQNRIVAAAFAETPPATRGRGRPSRNGANHHGANSNGVGNGAAHSAELPKAELPKAELPKSGAGSSPAAENPAKTEVSTPNAR